MKNKKNTVQNITVTVRAQSVTISSAFVKKLPDLEAVPLFQIVRGLAGAHGIEIAVKDLRKKSVK